MAHRFSAKLGLASGQDAGRVEGHLRTVGLPTRVQDIPGHGFTDEELLEGIAQDKKVTRGALTFILTRGIGKAFIERGVEPAAVRDFLQDELS